MRRLRALEHWIGEQLSLLEPRRRAAHREVLARARPADPSRPLVVFDLSSLRLARDGGRDLHRLVTLFRESGHAIAFLPGYRFLSRLGRSRYSRLLLDHPYTLLGGLEEVPERCTFVTDRRRAPPRPARVLRLHFQAGYSQHPARLAVPYGRYPRVEEHALATGGVAPEVQRRWRLFFAGNARLGKYDRRGLDRTFGKLSRRAILAELSLALDEQSHRRVGDATSLAELGRDRPFRGFVHVDSASLAIPVESWLDTLARAEFFLACPGVSMPTCHNAIEAMSVGCIPVLEHPEHFHPSLRDGVDCIAFAGRSELRRQVRRVLGLGEAEIALLRRGTREYHQRHLSPAGFGRELAQRGSHLRELYLNAHLSPARPNS